MDRESDKYVTEIHKLCSRNLVRHDAWRDLKQDEFINRHVLPLVEVSYSYARALDENASILEKARLDISRLIGEDSGAFMPVSVGEQRVNGGYSGDRDPSYAFIYTDNAKSR